MKPTALLFALGLAASSQLHAQILLEDFSNYTPSYFSATGSWSADTAQTSAGRFTIADFGLTRPQDDGGFFTVLSAPRDWSTSSFSQLRLGGFTPASNASDYVYFYVEDTQGRAATTAFSLAAYSTGSAAHTAQVNWTTATGDALERAAIAQWGFVTEAFASADFAFAFDQLEFVTSTTATPVPEPATTGAVAGAGLLAFALYRSRRRTSRA